jgi:RNA polymerase sigma-70 factor, ECF subfamily
VDERLEAHSEDRDLLAAFAGGDRSALGELASRHERRLLGLALGLLGSRELAEEAVQDAWVRVVEGAGGFKGEASVRTWLYRIVINRCRDIARRERSQRARLNGSAGSPRPEARGQRALEDAESRAVLRRAVASLGPLEREAVLLCHHADLTNAQAAEILRVPLGTLKSRVRSGIARLRSVVEEDES